MAFDENRTQSALSLAYDVILSSIISCVYPDVYVSSSSEIKKRTAAERRQRESEWEIHKKN